MTEKNYSRDGTEVVIITGLSGAGRSTVSNALEDIGFFVIDNIPPPLITRVVNIATKSNADEGEARVAFVCDAREGALFNELDAVLHELFEQDVNVRLVFCDASDESLIRRFDESRRPHPLGQNDGVAVGIKRERELLQGLKVRADFVLDTSELSVHDLRRTVANIFREVGDKHALRVAVQSFGFKNGAPWDADMVLDVRFLPNPYWVQELRSLPGTDPTVRDYVMGSPETKGFLDKLFDLIDYLLPHYVAEGKSYFNIAIGCTGGRHRSVVLTREIASHIEALGYHVNILDRDLKS